MMMGTSRSSSNLNVFTAAQWEELEQQALIYKYMVSGVPVPTHLILSVRRSLYNSSSSSSSSSSSLSNQPPTSLGVWEGSFQYNQLYQIGGGGGYGRKIDLEPGRCRRTDGKKWRCSKEAYPDSKYCERHMHRGRNRSRKPVEFSSSSSSSSTSSAANISTSASTTTTTTTTTTFISKSTSPSDAYQNTLHPHYSSSRPPLLHPNFVDSSSYSHQTLKDYRYLQGMKDLGEDERSAYLQSNDPYTTAQKMAAASSSDHPNYSHFNFQNLNHQDKEEETQRDGGQHCYVLGTDFIKETNTKVDETTHNKQPFHHFFSPPKPTPHDPNWVDQNHNFLNPPKSPLSTQDLFQSKPRPYW